MNSIQVEDILDTIDINYSSDNEKDTDKKRVSSLPASIDSPAGSNCLFSGTRIERIEMPIPSLIHPRRMNASSSSNGGATRNNRRIQSFIFKSMVIFALTSLVVFTYVHSKAYYNDIEKEQQAYFADGDTQSKFNTNRYSSKMHDPLPNYAPLNIDEREGNVIETKKTNILETKGNIGVEQSAAEALQCPQSVINFVVNATDSKDECDGLRKAFDKTCGDGESEKGHHFRRMLSDFDSGADDVGSNWNALAVFKELFSKVPTAKKYDRRIQEQDESEKGQILSEVEGDDKTDIVEKPEDKTEVVENPEDKTEIKHLSPMLPTGSQHMSDKMAGDALGLNAELSDIAKAIEDMGNTTNDNEQGQRPHVDAHGDEEHIKSQSGHDIVSAAIAVSAIMNNPEAIEIQSCCRSILQVFHDECDNPDDEEYADRRLFVIVCVIALCGLIKSLIRHFKIRWLPEAGGCILVGVVGGLFLKILPNIDFAFSHDMFLRVMVPPIVFEAALNINKSSFRKMIIPIVILALFGTIMSTMLTAAIVFYGSHYFHNCTSIPFIESLTFGALISSIDPIAVLSVLSNMGMSDKDQIYVIIFGESLLNDGVAIVLFQTLMNFMDESMVIDGEAVYLATLQFLVIAFGSLFVGLASGLSGTLYFWLMQGIQTPLVEVIMFICWAFIPYYICDGIEWSGIVAIVAVGFFMDVYIIGNKSDTEIKEELDENQQGTLRKRKRIHHSMLSQKGFLSAKAKNHIRFVTEINSTLMETAIFAYLGIFLFNKRYHWSLSIPLVGIISCVFSRAVTVWFFSFISNLVTRFGSLRTHRMDRACGKSGDERNGPVIIDTRMQTVLIFAGLRGAMSFALVETVPMFDGSTGQGSRFKPELKAMTSACIMFTVFVLGGYTDYLLERVGMKPSNDKRQDIEMVSLMSGSGSRDDDIDPSDQWETASLKQRSSVTRSIVSDDRNVDMW